MKKINSLSVAVLVLFCFQIDAQENINEQKEQWEITIAPYMLLGSINGETTIGLAGPAEVDVEFKDLLEKLQFSIMLHAEAQIGKWGIITDFIYMKLGQDLNTPTEGVLEASVQESILEVFANYRIKKDWGSIDLYGGIRRWDINVDLELEGILSGEANRDEGWVDPVIGGRIFYNFSNKIVSGLRMDIGGFGAGSDFSYNLQLGLGYHFSDLFTLMLQYKYLSSDYKNGKDGRDFFALDAVTHGPLIGFIFQFLIS